MKTLNPIMAALLAAFAGVVLLRPCAVGQIFAPPAPAVAVGDLSPIVEPAKAVLPDEQNPVNALAQLLRDNAEARAAAGKRAASFLLDAGAAGKSFVSRDVSTEALSAVALDWAGKQDAGRLAVLYFVMGPGGDSLAWAAADPIVSQTLKPGMQWEGRLRAALDRWTDSDQIGQTMEREAATAFLEDAADQAASVLQDRRTQPEIDASIAGNDTTAPQVPTPSRVASSLGGGARSYSYEELYVRGAVVVDVYGPGDKVSRKISAKIYTSRDENGKLVNQIGIFDITDPNDIVGQRFNFGVGEQTFALNDSAPGYRTYTLKIETDRRGERSITFARAVPAKKGPFGLLSVFESKLRSTPLPSKPLVTSVEQLLLKRAEQAKALDTVVSVGGRDYYVTPQGGETGALVFLSKDKVEDRSLANARELRPDLYVEVAAMDSEGRAANSAGKRHLGTVDGKDYHLEFNFKTGLWDIKDGPGDDKPKPPTKEPDPSKPPKPPKPGPAAAGAGSPTASELEKSLLAQTPAWTKDPDDTAEMDADLRDAYRILSRRDDQSGLQYSVLVPQTVASSGQILYKNIAAGADAAEPLVLERVMGWKHYLIVQFDREQRYLDLRQPDAETGFKLVGYMRQDGAGSTDHDFTDEEAKADALRRFGSFPAPEEQRGHAGQLSLTEGR